MPAYLRAAGDGTEKRLKAIVLKLSVVLWLQQHHKRDLSMWVIDAYALS